MKRVFPVIFALALCARAFACTTVIVPAAASESGRPLVFKQRDTPLEDNILMHFKEGYYEYTGLIEKGNPDQVWAGANDVGLLISNNLSYNLSDRSLSGTKLHAGQIMKAALASCASVDEFEVLVDSMRVLGVQANFAVADALGAAAYFEVWDSACVRFDVPVDEPLTRTNFSLSGKEGSGRGYERFSTASRVLRERRGKISSRFLLDCIGRNFEADGEDALRGSGPLKDLPDIYIPRNLTTAGLVLEGMIAGDAKGSALIYTAAGYTPCCYAVPIPVLADNESIPTFLKDGSIYRLAVDLRDRIEIETLREVILPHVRSCEKKEFQKWRRVSKRIRSGKPAGGILKKCKAEAEKRYFAYRCFCESI